MNDEELERIKLEMIDTFQSIDTSTSQLNPWQRFMNRLENLLEANGIKKTEINSIYYCSGCNNVIITSSFEEELCSECKSKVREEKINKIIEK